MPERKIKTGRKRKCDENDILENISVIDLAAIPSNTIQSEEDAKYHKVKKNKRKLTTKKCINQELNLCDLPKELLGLIIGNVNIWHHNRIRAACKTFMNVCDSTLMHEYKKSMYKFSKIDKTGYEFVAMTAIQQATWAYVYSGYSSLFLGTMLPLMRNSYRTPFAPPIKNIKKFLKKFYQLVQNKLGDPMHQHSRFLYTLILLGFFKKFQNCKLLSSIEIHSGHWHVVYELCGSWFGMLWSSKRPTFNYVTDRVELLLLLTELMISAHSENTFKKLWEGDTKVFICGYDSTQRLRKPKVTFHFDIQGTQSILNCFKNIPATAAQDLHIWDNINCLPTDEFNLYLKITCKEAAKWGCYDYYQMDFGPNQTK